MPKLTVQNLAQLQVKIAPGQTLLQALQAQGQDWMHACGGKGRCTTEAEIRYRSWGRLQDNERLACQCTLEGGNAIGKVPEQTKLPHLIYS